MNKIINFILLITFIALYAPENYAQDVFWPNEATAILQTFYHWLTPENEFSQHQQPTSWADAISGWEKADQAHCAVFEDFARKKPFEEAMRSAVNSLKASGLIVGLEANMQMFVGDLLGKISEKIDAKIREKSLKKSQSLLIMFREVFSIGKQLVAILLDARSEWREKKIMDEKEKTNNVFDNQQDEQKQQRQRREFAVHKYAQLELFFTKCALRMHKIRNGKSPRVWKLRFPNDQKFFSEPYFSSKIIVQWWQQHGSFGDDDTYDGILTRDFLSMDQAAGMVALLKTFIGNLCVEVGLKNNASSTGASSRGGKTVITEGKDHSHIVSDIDSLYECASANGVQFAKLFELFTGKVLEQWQNHKGQQQYLSPLAQELLLYELHRIRQRLEDIEREVELTEQKKVRALIAVMAKYGAKMIDNLLRNQPKMVAVIPGKISAKSSFLLDKYHYMDMAEWFEAVHKKMKRHIKYHVNAIVYAPNGIRTQPLRTPTIDGHSNTIDEGSEFLKKIELTADVQLITTLIEDGKQTALEDDGTSAGKKLLLNKTDSMCAELEKLKQQITEKDLHIIEQLMKELRNGGLFIEQLMLNGNELQLQCKLKLTAIYRIAIESALEPESDKFASSAWHRKAAEELDAIVGRIWGLHLAESSVAKTFSGLGCNGKQIGVSKACKISNYDETNLMVKELKAKLDAAMMNVENISLSKKTKLNTIVDQLKGKFVKLAELHGSLQRVLSAHKECPRQQIKPFDAEVIRGAVNLQDGGLKLLRQYALEEVRKVELDALLGASEKRNVIEFGTSNAKAILQLDNFKFGSYDQEGNTLSVVGLWAKPFIQFPGEFRLISGNLRITDESLEQHPVKQSFMATAKFSLKICLFWPACFSVCENGELGKKLDNSIEFILRMKGITMTEVMIQAEIREFKAVLKCSVDFLFHKEIFELGSVTFSDRVFRHIFVKQFGIGTISENLDIISVLAGFLEPEEGFFELPSLLSKNIWMPKKNVKFKFGIEVFEAAKMEIVAEKELRKEAENKVEKGEDNDDKAPLMFGGRSIISLKLPANNDYLEMRLV